MKQTIYQKLRNSNRNTFSFIPHVCYFSCHPWVAASKGRSLTTQEYQHPCPIQLEFRDSSPPLCKNHKKPEVAKKTQACETITLTKSFAFSWCRCSKQSVSCLLTMIWSEHFIRWGFFQICSGNNNTSLLLYACELSYLISKGMIFPYVQEQGGILLKFNILRLHFVTHRCTCIECQPFQSSPEVIQETQFAQYGKIILKPLKNCFL